MNNTNTPTQNNKSNKLNITIKVLIIVLIILVLLSLGILLVRLGDFLPNNTDIFFIEPKIADTELSDDGKVWELDTKVDIFKVEEKNEKGEFSVISKDGNKVIAPGMEGNYSFQIKNLGNVAVNLKTVFNVEFIVENLK